jgi:hypothetical protein
MTQDEIIEMAEQAGMTQDGDMWFSFGKGDMDVEHEHLAAFAKLVAAKAEAKERDACAKVCDQLVNEENSEDYRNAANWCSIRIRARGEA